MELTAIRRERLDALVLALAQDPGLVDGFEHVSVHAPARDFVDDPEPVVAALRTLPYDIVLHPDVYRGRAGSGSSSPAPCSRTWTP